MPSARLRFRGKSSYLSTAVLVGLVCLALVALDGARTWQAYHDQIHDTKTATDNLVQSLTQHVEDAIRNIDIGILGIKQQAEVHGLAGGEDDKLHDQMVAQVGSTAAIHGLFLYDEHGAPLTNTLTPAPHAMSFVDRDYFKYHRDHDENHFFVGGPYRSRTDGTWIISISRRINHPDGRFAGVVAGTLALDMFRKYYDSFDIGGNGVLLLARDDGTIVVRRPFEERFVGARFAGSPVFSQIVPAATSGSFEDISLLDGMVRLGSFRRVPGSPLVVLAALDQDEVLAGWRSEARGHAVGAVLVIIIIFLLGLRLAKQIRADRRAEGCRQSEKMEVIGRVAAGVAHDFNNILQVIVGGMDVLRDERALSKQGQAFIGTVEAAAGRGSQLTHHLLCYSGMQALDPQILAVGEVLASLRPILSRILGNEVVVTIEPARQAGLIRADRGQLEAALTNLAINARHAMPSGGTIRYHTTVRDAAEFEGIGPGRYVVLAMSDSGAGMTANVLAHAFDPFFTTKGVEGSGLGLPMVQGFSRQSGGDARAISEPGTGTRIEIWLPEVLALGVQPAVERQAGTARGGHILLVDDDPDVLVMVDAFLRKGGFGVHRAGDGYAALEALAAGERFDMLVTDFMMPGLDGLGLIQQARLFQPELKALVMSGFADAIGFMSELPNATLLRKPFQRAQLIAAVVAMIAEEAAS